MQVLQGLVLHAVMHAHVFITVKKYMVKCANDGKISKTHLNNVFLTYSQFQQRYESHAYHRSDRNMIMLNLGGKVHAAQLHTWLIMIACLWLWQMLM